MDIFLEYLKPNFIIIIIIIVKYFDGDNKVPLSSGDLEQGSVSHKISLLSATES